MAWGGAVLVFTFYSCIASLDSRKTCEGVSVQTIAGGRGISPNHSWRKVYQSKPELEEGVSV